MHTYKQSSCVCGRTSDKRSVPLSISEISKDSSSWSLIMCFKMQRDNEDMEIDPAFLLLFYFFYFIIAPRTSISLYHLCLFVSPSLSLFPLHL